MTVLIPIGLIDFGHVSRGVVLDHTARTLMIPAAQFHQALPTIWGLPTQMEMIKRAIKSVSDDRVRTVLIGKLKELGELYAEHRFTEHRVREVQKRWRDIISNPYHNLCRARLIREYTTLMHDPGNVFAFDGPNLELNVSSPTT
jgi:hypothetical protein